MRICSIDVCENICCAHIHHVCPLSLACVLLPFYMNSLDVIESVYMKLLHLQKNILHSVCA